MLPLLCAWWSHYFRLFLLSKPSVSWSSWALPSLCVQTCCSLTVPAQGSNPSFLLPPLRYLPRHLSPSLPPPFPPGMPPFSVLSVLSFSLDSRWGLHSDRLALGKGQTYARSVPGLSLLQAADRTLTSCHLTSDLLVADVAVTQGKHYWACSVEPGSYLVKVRGMHIDPSVCFRLYQFDLTSWHKMDATKASYLSDSLSCR